MIRCVILSTSRIRYHSSVHFELPTFRQGGPSPSKFYRAIQSRGTIHGQGVCNWDGNSVSSACLVRCFEDGLKLVYSDGWSPEQNCLALVHIEVPHSYQSMSCHMPEPAAHFCSTTCVIHNRRMASQSTLVAASVKPAVCAVILSTISRC